MRIYIICEAIQVSHVSRLINERWRGKVNEATSCLIILPLKLRPRKLSPTSGSLRSTSTDALSVRKIGKEMSFLHNVAATTMTRSIVSLPSSFWEMNIIVVPLVLPVILVLIEIEKSIVFAKHKLPGISTLECFFFFIFSTLSSFILIFFKCTREILSLPHVLPWTLNLSCFIHTNMSNEENLI